MTRRAKRLWIGHIAGYSIAYILIGVFVSWNPAHWTYWIWGPLIGGTTGGVLLVPVRAWMNNKVIWINKDGSIHKAPKSYYLKIEQNAVPDGL